MLAGRCITPLQRRRIATPHPWSCGSAGAHVYDTMLYNLDEMRGIEPRLYASIESRTQSVPSDRFFCAKTLGAQTKHMRAQHDMSLSIELHQKLQARVGLIEVTLAFKWGPMKREFGSCCSREASLAHQPNFDDPRCQYALLLLHR